MFCCLFVSSFAQRVHIRLLNYSVDRARCSWGIRGNVDIITKYEDLLKHLDTIKTSTSLRTSKWTCSGCIGQLNEHTVLLSRHSNKICASSAIIWTINSNTNWSIVKSRNTFTTLRLIEAKRRKQGAHRWWSWEWQCSLPEVPSCYGDVYKNG